MQQHPRSVRAAVVALALVVCAWASADVTVNILGRATPVDPAPIMRDGRLEGSPLPILAKLGCTTTVGDDQRLIVGAPNGARIELVPGADQVLVNGERVPAGGAIRIEGGRLICPLRAVLAAVGCELVWDGRTQTLAVAARITGVVVRADRQGCEVAITTTLPVEGMLEHIADPERWYVDLPGAVVGLDRELTWVSTGSVRRVRWGQFENCPPVTRVVADLIGPAQTSWRPREDRRGGSIIVGTVDGDEPVIDRPVPTITGLTAACPDDRVTRLRVSMTDPVDISWEVLRKPPRVVMQFPDARMGADAGCVPIAGPFVESAELQGSPAGAGTTLTLNMRQLIQFEVRRYDDPAAVDIIFKRERLADKRIVLDPGHGAHDPGAIGARLKEKDVNLDVARRAAGKLLEIGAQVRLTRDSDVFIDLYDRPRIATDLGADLFVSIHCNAMPTPNTGHGTETFYCTPQSMCLGQIMQAALVDGLGRTDRGLKRARFVVVREATMPAVLVELMFLNNDKEHALLERPEVRQTAAEAICEGLRQYVEGTGTAAERTELGR